MQHHIRLTLTLQTNPDQHAYHVTLQPHHHATYRWIIRPYNKPKEKKIYSQSLQHILSYYQQTPKLLQEIIPKRSTNSLEIIANTTSITPKYPQKEQSIRIGNIQIHPHPQHGHYIQLRPLHYNPTAPAYNITDILHIPAQAAAMYLQQHIPTHHIIHQKYIQTPNKLIHQPDILMHYHPALPKHMPCAVTRLTDMRGQPIPAYSMDQQDIPQNITHHYIGLCSINRDLNPIYTIHPDAPYEDIAPILSQHIQQQYFDQYNTTNDSQHAYIALRRTFHAHLSDITHQIYNNAMNHRQERLQSLIFTFPRN